MVIICYNIFIIMCLIKVLHWILNTYKVFLDLLKFLYWLNVFIPVLIAIFLFFFSYLLHKNKHRMDFQFVFFFFYQIEALSKQVTIVKNGTVRCFSTDEQET